MRAGGINFRVLQRTRSVRGVTVLELLIVMTILLMITAATIPIMMPAMQNRRMRETSRLVSSFINGARARAIEHQRPVGVMFQRLNSSPMCVSLVYVEVPLPYAGETIGDKCDVQLMGPQLQVILPVTANTSLIGADDTIQLNFQGPRYRIASVNGATLNLDPPLTRHPWTTTPVKATYQIFRKPLPTSSSPLLLPDGVIIDLSSSGMGVDGSLNSGTEAVPLVTFDPVVVFGTNGSVKLVSSATGLSTPTGPLFFLLGRPELMPTVNKTQRNENVYDPHDPRLEVTGPSPPRPMPYLPPTYRYLENFWISIGYQSGLVSVTEMARNPQLPIPDTMPTQTYPQKLANARALAISGQNIGGR